MGSNYSSNTKKTYFKLLNKTLKKNQDRNSINQTNLEYSFITKTFPNPYNEYFDEPNITIESRSITWKSYLILILKYLSLNKKYIWARNLEIFIKNNKFVNQYKYLSLFFYEDFKISSMPNISSLNNEDKYSYQKSNLFSKIENEDNEFDNERTNINKKKGYKETIDNIYNQTKVYMSNELLGSLASISFDEINSFLIENEPTVKYKVGKDRLKKYIFIFKNHLCYKDHPINIILNQFASLFKPIIIKVCEDLKGTSTFYGDEGNYDEGKNIIYQLQEFMQILQVATKLFYSKCTSYDFFQDEKDEFINLISFLVFNTDDIYKNIYALLKIMNSSKITQFTNKINQFGELDPEEMGVKEKFCLNETTKDYMNKYKKNQINIINKKPELKNLILNNEKNALENIKEEDETDNQRQSSDNIYQRSKLNLNINPNLIDISNNTMPKKKLNLFGDLDEYFNKKDNQQKNLVYFSTNNNVDTNLNINLDVSEEERKNKKNQFLLKFSRRYSSINISIENNMPYHEEIETLENISKCKTPLEKMITIASISSIIINSIYNFWKPIKELVKPSFLNVEADEIIKIFTYIVYTSKMSELVVHLDFIKFFTISSTKKTMIGYYYSILLGAVKTILEAKNIDSFLN